MRITKIGLQNVKSYAAEPVEVEFADGVNFLTGPNGAGKSTLIEAIGYALFDVNPLTVKDLVRRGAKTGVVTAWIEDQGEEFRIERKFGASSSWVVYDKDDVSLHEKRPDVVRFLCERLRIADENQLETVFGRIVGVPQGMFTAVFKMQPAERKSIFDPIINVNIYRDRSEQRKGVKNQLVREALADLDVNLRAAESFLSEHKQDPVRLAETEQRVTVLKDQIVKLTTSKEVLQMRKEAFDKTKKLLDALDLKLAEVATLLDGQRKARKKAEEGVGHSRTAAGVCKKTESGHKKWAEAEKDLAALEKKRKSRDALLKEVHELEKRLQSEETAIASAEKVLVRDGEQESRRAAEAAKAEESWKALEKEASALEKAAEKESAALAKLTETFEAEEAREEAFRERLEKAKTAAEHIEEMIPEIAENEKALQSLEEIQQRADRAEPLKKAEAAVQRRIDQRETEIGEHRKNKRELAKLVCPFIKEPCDRVKPEVFDAKIEALETGLGEDRDVLEAAEKEAKSAAVAEKQLAALREKKDQLAKTKRSRAGEWAKAKKLVAEWEPEKGAKYPEFPEDEGAELDLAEFNRYAATWGKNLDGRKRQLAAAESEEKKSSLSAAGKRRDADAANKKLEDARERLGQARDEVKAGTKDLEARRKTLEGFAGKRQDLARKATEFAGLDGELESAQKAIEQHKPAHEDYVGNAKEAGELDKRQKEVLAIEDAICVAEADKAGATAERTSAAASWDTRSAKKVSSDLEEVAGQLGAAETEAKNQVTLRAQLSKSVEEMRDRQAKIDRWKIEKARMERFRDVLEAIWEVLRKVGPRISQRLLGGISSRANRIFGLLNDGPGQLVWGADYAVSLKRADGDLPFANLSGGEQMSAALAIQMAMARDFAGSSFCIFDEPTIHLDDARRSRLAAAIQEARKDAGFNQVFIVSHDDTFAPFVDHAIRLRKDPMTGTSVVS